MIKNGKNSAKDSKLDSYIDTFFKRVDSPSKSNISDANINKLPMSVIPKPKKKKNKLKNIEESSVTSDSVSSHKEDGDLFFFDLSGNPRNGVLAQSSPTKNTSQHFEKDTIVDMIDSDMEITYSGKKKRKNGALNTSETDSSYLRLRDSLSEKHKKKCKNGGVESSQESDTLLFQQRKKKKRKINNDIEMHDLSGKAAKKRKPVQIDIFNEKKSCKKEHTCSTIDISDEIPIQNSDNLQINGSISEKNMENDAYTEGFYGDGISKLFYEMFGSKKKKEKQEDQLSSSVEVIEATQEVKKDKRKKKEKKRIKGLDSTIQITEENSNRNMKLNGFININPVSCLEMNNHNNSEDFSDSKIGNRKGICEESKIIVGNTKINVSKQSSKKTFPMVSTPLMANTTNKSGNIVMELLKSQKNERHRNSQLNDATLVDILGSIFEDTNGEDAKNSEKGDKTDTLLNPEKPEHMETEDLLNILIESDRIEGKIKNCIGSPDLFDELTDSKELTENKRKGKKLHEGYDGDISFTEENEKTQRNSKSKIINSSSSQSEPKEKISKKKKRKNISNKYYSEDSTESDNDQYSDTEHTITKIINSEKTNVPKLDVDDIFIDHTSMEKEKRNRKSCSMTDNGSDQELNTTVDISGPEELDEEELEILRNLTITLPFEYIPPLHMIKRPSKATLDDMNRAKIFEAKFGSFSKEEDAKIIRNWKRFLEDHNLNVRPAIFFKFKRVIGLREKTKFLQYLSHGLDDRLPFRIHIRFRKLFEKGHLKKGRFTPYEDQEIMNFLGMTKSPKPFHDLGVLLNRSSQSVEKRYGLLISEKNLDPVKWNLKTSERLIKLMMKISETDSVKDLEHLTLTEEQWKILSKEMGDIPVKKLRRAWKITIHPRLFVKEDLEEVKRKLINLMIENGEKDYRTVNWEKLSLNFRGINDRKLYDIFRLMMARVPQKIKGNLESVLEYLSTHYVRLRKHPQIRYKFKNGILQYRSNKNEET